MSEKFQNKYRNESTRMPGWDYGWKGAYFITLVTRNRKHYFGRIVNSVMIKSELGFILQEEWLKTPAIRPEMNIILGEYCVMPDHFHAIIEIGRNQYNKFNNEKQDSAEISINNSNNNLKKISGNNLDNNSDNDRNPVDSDADELPVNQVNGYANNRDAMHRDPIPIPNADTDPTIQQNPPITRKRKNKFGPQRKNLSSIIRGIKSAVTTYARKNNIEFGWQPNYYDHIIRNKSEYYRIQNYIINNPRKWPGN